MPLGMKNNIASINAINHLAKAQKEMSDSLTRLASGQRVNTGADAPESLVSCFLMCFVGAGMG